MDNPEGRNLPQCYYERVCEQAMRLPAARITTLMLFLSWASKVVPSSIELVTFLQRSRLTGLDVSLLLQYPRCSD